MGFGLVFLEAVDALADGGVGDGGLGDLVEDALDFGAVVGFAEEVGEDESQVGFAFAVLHHHAVNVGIVGAVEAVADAIEDSQG